jgi:endonuclease/exonuclease/phosphatase family metal-dependent hydrolase
MTPLLRLLLGWFLFVPLLRAETYTVCHWNVENFGITDRFIENKRVKAAMKPESEINAMLNILGRIKPDILGVCEILQDPKDQYVKLLRQRLKEKGLDYPYLSTAKGEDPRIQCVLLSRFPIVKEEPITEESFKTTIQKKDGTKSEEERRPSRAILNTLIQVNDKTALRVFYCHLKSKRAYPEIVSDEKDETGDSFVRRHEALILKNASLRALEANPNEKQIIMGDFNDTPKSRAVQTIFGRKDASVRMFDLWLKDYFGDMWTHYYVPENEYSRIDYMVASQSLFETWVPDKSYLYRCNQADGAEFSHYSASDHRPLVAVFEMEDGQPKTKKKTEPPKLPDEDPADPK